MNRKGLAFETLAKVAIVVLILVSVTVFFVVGMQKFTKTFSGAVSTEGMDLDNARATCNRYCMSMNNILADKSKAVSQPYCTRIFYLQEDGDPDDKDYCYDDLISGGTPCTVRLSNGEEVRIDKNACQGGDYGYEGTVTG